MTIVTVGRLWKRSLFAVNNPLLLSAVNGLWSSEELVCIGRGDPVLAREVQQATLHRKRVLAVCIIPEMH